MNPEVAHEHDGRAQLPARGRAGLGGGQAGCTSISNDQAPGRYDQDFRFGSANVKAAFWLVKFLEDVGYAGPRHFDAHAYRTEDYEGVKDFARGCMRTYLILKERAKRWNADVGHPGPGQPRSARANPFQYSRAHRDYLLGATFDRAALARKGLAYERLDQLTMEVLLGVR